MDEPRATQPLLYQEIDEHETVKNVFAKELQAEGVIDEAEFTALNDKVLQGLQEIYDSMKENPTSDEVIKEMPKVLANGIDQFETAEIGRASCRERVKICVGEMAWKDKIAQRRV